MLGIVTKHLSSFFFEKLHTDTVLCCFVVPVYSFVILPAQGSLECEPLLGHELLGSPVFVGHPESGQRTAK